MLSTICLTLLLTLTSCSRESTPKPAIPPRQTYSAEGVVKALEPDGRTVVIQHGEISNYMPAMTMPFQAKSSSDLAGLHPGDYISFDLVVTPDDGWIEHVLKTSPPSTPTAPTNTAPSSDVDSALSQFHVRHALAPLDVGDRVPDIRMTNELGQPVRLGGYRGQVIAFTFIFTRCPFPTACPRLSANFAEVQEKLKKSADAPLLWHLFSITFDPDNDTPAVLKDYAARYKCDPARWNFLTGGVGEISDFADQCGEQFRTSGASISHNFRTVIVGPDGRIRKLIEGNTWTSDDIVQEMISAAAQP